MQSHYTASLDCWMEHLRRKSPHKKRGKASLPNSHYFSWQMFSLSVALLLSYISTIFFLFPLQFALCPSISSEFQRVLLGVGREYFDTTLFEQDVYMTHIPNYTKCQCKLVWLPSSQPAEVASSDILGWSRDFWSCSCSVLCNWCPLAWWGARSLCWLSALFLSL